MLQAGALLYATTALRSRSLQVTVSVETRQVSRWSAKRARLSAELEIRPADVRARRGKGGAAEHLSVQLQISLVIVRFRKEAVGTGSAGSSHAPPDQRILRQPQDVVSQHHIVTGRGEESRLSRHDDLGDSPYVGRHNRKLSPHGLDERERDPLADTRQQKDIGG